MAWQPAVDSIAQSIQLAVAPVFLLTGIGSILNVLATRLGRRLGFDDSFAVVGIHLVGGVVGMLYIGFIGSAIGFIYTGSPAAFGAQSAAAFGVAAYSFVLAWLIGFVIEKTIGLGIRTGGLVGDTGLEPMTSSV